MPNIQRYKIQWTIFVEKCITLKWIVTIELSTLYYFQRKSDEKKTHFILWFVNLVLKKKVLCFVPDKKRIILWNKKWDRKTKQTNKHHIEMNKWVNVVGHMLTKAKHFLVKSFKCVNVRGYWYWESHSDSFALWTLNYLIMSWNSGI